VDARLLEPLLDLVARAARVAQTHQPDRQLLAADARLERLRERADHRRDPLRGAPVVVIPPHAVAGLDLVVGGAVGRLDALDVIEPADLPPLRAAARHAVDLLHEAAAVLRLDREVALQQPHHGVAGARGLALGGRELGVPEVLRDPDRDLAARRRAGPESAARGKQRKKDGEALHRTVNTTRVVPRLSGVRLPAPSIAIASST